MGIINIKNNIFLLRVLSLILIAIITFLITAYLQLFQLSLGWVDSFGAMIIGPLIITTQVVILILLFIRQYDIKKEKQKRKETEKKLEVSQVRFTLLNDNLEKTIQSKTKYIKNLLKQKDDFIIQLSHDLKSPLGPIKNLLPLLAEDESDPDKKEMYDIIISNVKHMENLVKKIITLTHLNAPSSLVYLEKINLLTEIKEIIYNNKIQLDEKNIKIKNYVDKELFIKADKLKLYELIDNLINNCIKYTHNNGTISIEAKKEERFVTISIKDNGIGLTKQQISHIFDEFYKADESRHFLDSSGLGLTICKRIVGLHNGRIWAESIGLGYGTSINFTIPIYKESKDKIIIKPKIMN